MAIETTRKEYEDLIDVQDCSKNPTHEGFYSVNELTADILPENMCKTEQCVDYIRYYSKRVVRLIVNRPNGGSLFGTGCVFEFSPISDKLFILTNHHVVGSQEDVSNCRIEFFYDTVDRKGIVTSFGVELLYCNKKLDLCAFCFHTVPQSIKQLLPIIGRTPSSMYIDATIAISHPHGGPKKITFGTLLGHENDDGKCHWIHNAKTCPGSSGGLVLQPCLDWQIPSVNLEYFLKLIHYAGKTSDVFNRKMFDNNVVTVVSKTGNINYSVML